MGNPFKAFMMTKLIPVAGNVCEPNLGMDPDTTNEIAKEVDVIINSAGNTNFDERFLYFFSLNVHLFKTRLF